jgi:hypothetical protein
MKKFDGVKPLAAIKKQCRAAGIHFSDRLYREGSDYVVITSIKGDNHSGQVLFNQFNGNFFGTTPAGVQFDSKKTTHEKEPWFQALLAFFYVEKGTAA